MTAAAVAAKVALVVPDCTATVAGTLNAAAMLLERDTVVPPEGAALERVMVQTAVEEAARLPPPHCSDVTVMGEVGAVMEKAVEALEAPMEAITVTY